MCFYLFFPTWNQMRVCGCLFPCINLAKGNARKAVFALKMEAKVFDTAAFSFILQFVTPLVDD